jgi:hypothetical protein
LIGAAMIGASLFWSVRHNKRAEHRRRSQAAKKAAAKRKPAAKKAAGKA